MVWSWGKRGRARWSEEMALKYPLSDPTRMHLENSNPNEATLAHCSSFLSSLCAEIKKNRANSKQILFRRDSNNFSSFALFVIMRIEDEKDRVKDE